VRASLGFLLEHLPPGLRLLLASCAFPPLPLARLRARGQLAELRAADLRFRAEEAAAVLREAVGPTDHQDAPGQGGQTGSLADFDTNSTRTTQALHRSLPDGWA
jgi:hypothetical protein